MARKRPAKKATKKAIGYVRVSTADQADEGVSIDAQAERITAYAKAQGLQLVEIHTDAGISGKRADNRPALADAIGQATDEQAALIVYSLSRLARSTRDAIDISEQLDAAGADLVSLTEQIDTTTAAGKMFFRMMAVLAEFERDLVSERTATALAHKRSKGEKTGGTAPYGFDIVTDRDGVKRLKANASEQANVRYMIRRRRAGDSLRKIAERLGERGATTRAGGRWHAKVIRDLIERASDAEGFANAAA